MKILSKLLNVGNGTRQTARIAGESLLYAGGSAALASALMSSIFSVENFAKDNDTLNAAKKALDNYMIIGGAWALGSSAVMYGEYGHKGFVAGVLANGAMMAWLWVSYQNAFKRASERHGLNVAVSPSWLSHPTERVFHPGELQDNIFVSGGEASPYYNGIQKRNPTGPGYPVLNSWRKL